MPPFNHKWANGKTKIVNVNIMSVINLSLLIHVPATSGKAFDFYEYMLL
jgi:hypothetical protein